MLHHQLLILFRNIRRFKGTFFINLIGLSTGLACALLIYLWVNDELQMNRFFKNEDRLYQVLEHQQNAKDNIRVTTSTPGLLAETLADEMPEVAYATVATPNWFDGFDLSVGEKRMDARGQYSSKDYFHVFSYDLLYGNAGHVLTDKNSIVISESVAQNLFGRADVVGQSILFEKEKPFIVSGVFKDLPVHSSVRFDFVISFELFKELRPGVLNWGNSGPETFVLLKEGTDVSAFSKKIADVIKGKHSDTHRTLIMNRYADTYLHDRYENGVQTGGRMEYVILFTVIAVFILAIACINFMNLSTARASRRMKEVGIKKTVGASRKVLVLQYLSESLFMSFLSLLVAVILVDVLLPQFNLITGKHLVMAFDLNVVSAFVGITFLTGLFAGSYPAFYLSGFNAVVVLKGRLGSSFGELWARKGLVVFQFAISVIFIVCVLVIYKQIEFLQTKNLGYDRENIVYFPIEGRLKNSRETFISELERIPGVVSASSIGQSMVGGGNTANVDWEGRDPDDRTPFAIRPVNYDVMEMLGFQLKAGRFFARDHSDSLKVIFNEAGIDAMGMKDPIGKTIDLGNGYDDLEIIGVVKDFHFESLRSTVNPMFFILAPDRTGRIVARIEAGKETETVRLIQDFYQRYNPGFTFEYRFLDEDYDAQYKAETRVSVLSKYFASLAVLISCLGLFGLVAFSAERRLKEIGIRKVLGSTEWGIVYLLSRDFTRIVVLAVVVALPLSYLMMGQWLNSFAYRIALEWWFFVCSGAMALLIAWITVGSQAWRASRVNPTRCLKEE
jgi:putative ABC transport system permease protein